MILYNYSISSIIFLIIITAITIIVFSFIKTYLPLFFKKHGKDNKIRNWLNLIEIFTILIFLIVFISYASSRNIIIALALTLILLLILFFLSHYYIKDYMVGLLIKSSGEYQLNDEISVDNINGRIIRFGKTQLIIKDQKGNNNYIPYTLLKAKIKTVQQIREKVNGYTFNFNLPKTNNYNSDTEELLQNLQLLPWVHPKHKASINFIEESDENYELEITVYAFDKKYYRIIEEALIQNLKS